jgi:hypothetical protein
MYHFFDVIDVNCCHWQKGRLGEDVECAEDGRFRVVRSKLTILNSLFNSSFSSNTINEEEGPEFWTRRKGFGTA